MSAQKKGKTTPSSCERPFSEAKNLALYWKKSPEPQETTSYETDAPVSKEIPCTLSNDDLAFMISNLEKRLEACERLFVDENPDKR